jgi:chaperonin GroEL (HSP60 family)
MNNGRAEKLVYVYVNSRSMKSVREHQRELLLAEAKGNALHALPKLLFDNTYQEPHVYGSLGHDNLTSIGLDAFDATDHVHELHGVIEGRGVSGHEDDTARTQYVLSSP